MRTRTHNVKERCVCNGASAKGPHNGTQHSQSSKCSLPSSSCISPEYYANTVVMGDARAVKGTWLTWKRYQQWAKSSIYYNSNNMTNL